MIKLATNAPSAKRSADIIVFPVIARPIPHDVPQIIEAERTNISERQSRKMSLWLVDCEKYLGLKATKAMLTIAMTSVEDRALSERQMTKLSTWLTDCEKYLGPKVMRAMITIALQWVENRLQFKRG